MRVRPHFNITSLLVVLAVALGGCEDMSPGPSCCRVCREGKACGDSCISRTQTCNVGPGCACNGVGE